SNGGPVILASSGSITEPNGIVTTSLLEAISTNGSVLLNGGNAIDTLINSGGNEFILNTTGPLNIVGQLSAPFMLVQAPGQITLTGTIATQGEPVAAPSGTLPTHLSSYIVVLPDGSGTGHFVQSGKAAISPLGASTATLQIQVPDSVSGSARS